MTVDPRLLERRKEVAEENAKRSLKRLLKLLVLLGVVAGLIWLAFSPWMSVRQVHTAGVASSETHRILAENRVVAGTPMFMIRTADVRERLVADPWVSAAEVTLEWPNEVVVRVKERVPVAWVETQGGWTRRAIDGVAVPSKGEPDESLPHVRLPAVDEPQAAESPFVLGALEFFNSLSPRWHPGATIRLEDGELWAEIGGWPVRLGRPTEMGQKARSLAALLTQDISPGSTLILIAPSNPAIAPASDDRMVSDEAEEVDPEQGGEDEGEP